MTLKPEILTAVQEAALAAGLPISIVRGMVCQESSGDPTATRYEPAFYQKYIKEKWPGEKDRATSYGLVQIMLQTARERGFRGEPQELLDPHIGLYWACRHINVLKERYFKKYGWAGVIAAYNAGSPRKRDDGKYVNQGYVDKVLKYAAGK